MTDTPTAEALANSCGIVRLWDDDNEFIWSSSERRPLVDVLAEIGDWTLATFDWPGRGRVWMGKMRLGEAGDIEAVPASEFLRTVRYGYNPALDR